MRLTRRCSCLLRALLIAVLLLHAPIAPAGEAVEIPAATNLHLYLLIGQSNMAGMGKMLPEDKIPEPRVLMLDKQLRWVPAVDPMHYFKPVLGVGPGRTFARAMLRHNDDITIGLIPCAVMGNPLVHWEKDGYLYRDAVKRTRAALANGTLKGILMHHGEADSRIREDAESYGTRVAQMIRDLRSALDAPDVPIVLGTLADFVMDNPYYPLASVVSDASRSIPDVVPFSAVVTTEGLHDRGDKVHFSRSSQEELGRRYAEAMKRLQAEHVERSKQRIEGTRSQSRLR